MKCPECEGPLEEQADQCPACGFSLAKIAKSFGQLHQLDPKVTDLTETLSRGQISRLRQESTRFGRQFPQLRFSVVFDEVPAGRKLATHCFWLFNTGDLCSELEKGGLNYHLLLVIDTRGRRAHLSVGYGLEPFVSETHLRDILEAGRQALAQREFVDAGVAIITQAMVELHRIGEQIPRAFGLDPQQHLAEA